MTIQDSIFKSRGITLLANVRRGKAVVFPVVIYRCEIWTIKNSEELTLVNCGAGEDNKESLRQQRDQTSQSKNKSTLNIN